MSEPALGMDEERYRVLADHVQDMISLHDLDGVFLYASPASRQLLGVVPTELLGRSVYELVHPDDVAALRAAHEAILTRTGRNPLTYRAIRPDGTERWFETTARVTTFSDEGVGPQVVALTRDVSERRVLEQQVAQMQKLEAVGRLAGGLAHDFNNLLTIVLGRADSLLEGVGVHDDAVPTRAELAAGLQEIHDAAHRASGLIGQLLAIGRRGTPEPQSLDLNATIREFTPLLARLAGADATFDVDLDPELWRLRADPVQVEQILMNLVANARDALDGAGHIAVTTRNVHLGGPGGGTLPLLVAGEYVLLAVHDSGRGMDEETVARIFEPFFTTRSEGSGLGLASVYAIVHASGGGVSVESRPDVGTTFRVYLPRAAEVGERSDEQDVTGDETILLVEDDDAVRSLMSTMLGRLGYVVHAFADPHSALEAAVALDVAPDLLLSDVIMPGLKGPELAQRLRQRFPDIRTLYISGYSHVALQRYGIREDDALLVQKPFTARTLARTVRQALGESRI